MNLDDSMSSRLARATSNRYTRFLDRPKRCLEDALPNTKTEKKRMPLAVSVDNATVPIHQSRPLALIHLYR